MVTCLVVDDDPAQRMLTRMVAQGTGRFDRIHEAGDGAEAIRHALAWQPDLVLLDLNMPGLDGVQAMPGLLRAAPGATIVVCSMERDGPRLDRARKAGAHGVIDKSLPIDRLASAIVAVPLRSQLAALA